MRELTLEEVGLVSGGHKPGTDGPSNDTWFWDNSTRDWGARTGMGGLGMIGVGAAITQLDTPLPGPSDVAGLGFIFAGIGASVVGGAAWAIGSVGGVVDYFRNGHESSR